MSEAAEKEAKDHPVLGFFKKSDPKTGEPVFYDPDGEKGWSGAKDFYSGVPGSKDVEELRAGAGAQHGPLIGEPKDVADEKTASRGATAGESKTTTSTAGRAGKES